jgi:hypothetical protein
LETLQHLLLLLCFYIKDVRQSTRQLPFLKMIQNTMISKMKVNAQLTACRLLCTVRQMEGTRDGHHAVVTSASGAYTSSTGAKGWVYSKRNIKQLECKQNAICEKTNQAIASCKCMKVFHCEATSKKNRTIEPRGETGKC